MPERVSSVAPGQVSVIIPAYNAERFIGAAVRSALAQRYRPIEILVVDNNCTDESVARAHAVGPVRVVTCSRPGPSAARNAGLDVAIGDFVQFLDADDLLPVGTLERHVEALCRTGADVVYGDFVRATVGGDGAVDTVLKRGRPRVGTSDPLAELIGPDDFLPLGAALVRRSTVTGGVRFDERIRVIEDVRYWIELAGAGASFARSDDEIGLVLREHDSPTRASRVAESEFWISCAENAHMVLDHWRARGEALTSARSDAVLDVWLHASEVLATSNDPRYAVVLRWITTLEPQYRSRLRSPHRWLTPLLGYATTMRMARIARSAARILRRARPATG